MPLTGNKGEWSEIYTLLKLLGEGRVYAGDQSLNRIQDLFYPIVMILRREKEENIDYRLEDKYVVLQTPAGMEVMRMMASDFLSEAESLLKSINEHDGSFSLYNTELFMQKIHCHCLKAKSSDKTDIRMILHDRRTRLNSEMGFSIKSQLGGNSTLLNASKSTNFKFKVNGNLSKEDISYINNLSPSKNKVLERVKTLQSKGCSLEFSSIDNQVFMNNLVMLDRDLPLIIANLLIKQIDTENSAIKGLVEYLTETNPLNYDLSRGNPYYAYKIKHFLTSVALGMMPATIWNGIFDANGGYLVVKKDGEILCYHFYDRNVFEDYLYNNAYLERASTTRHDYASIIGESDGNLYFRLNLQIRLK